MIFRLMFLDNFQKRWKAKKNQVTKEISRIGFFKLIKWGFYCVEIVSISNAFGSIYDALRIRVENVVHCFAYDNSIRCNWGIFICFLGIMTSMYSLTTSVFEEYMRIPQEMKFHESAAFLGFKIGLIFIVRRWLYHWHIEKIERTYFRDLMNVYDNLMRINRLNRMIGVDLRNVRSNLICANNIQIINFIMIFSIQKRNFRRSIKRAASPHIKEIWANIKEEWKTTGAPLNTGYIILKKFWQENYPFQMEQSDFLQELNQELLEYFVY